MKNLARNDAGQAEAFRDAAIDVGADQSDNALDVVMGKLDLTKKPKPRPAKK